jgi:transcriptional regulator GlxA family with amidase domain
MTADRLPVPADGRVKVAVLVDAGATVIDFAGPWEAFQDADPGADRGFLLYTVGPSRDPIRVSGYGLLRDDDGAVTEGVGGFQLVPEFTFDDAPQPPVVVMGAQGNHDAPKIDWIRRVAEDADVVVSVCTGAFLLAKTGLLDGLRATTHHDFFDRFEATFPAITLERGPRFVDNGRVVTGAGLTSGVDAALHVIARYFGAEVAREAARLMEYTPRVDPGEG